jgi:hypothetical protein
MNKSKGIEEGNCGEENKAAKEVGRRKDDHPRETLLGAV